MKAVRLSVDLLPDYDIGLQTRVPIMIREEELQEDYHYHIDQGSKLRAISRHRRLTIVRGE